MAKYYKFNGGLSMKGYSTPKSSGTKKNINLASRPSVGAAFLNGLAKGLKGGSRDIDSMHQKALTPVCVSR